MYLYKKAKRDYFNEATKYCVMANKEFWKKLKPFLTNKGQKHRSQG